jgi:hypothetical protein
MIVRAPRAEAKPALVDGLPAVLFSGAYAGARCAYADGRRRRPRHSLSLLLSFMPEAPGACVKPWKTTTATSTQIGMSGTA